MRTRCSSTGPRIRQRRRRSHPIRCAAGSLPPWRHHAHGTNSTTRIPSSSCASKWCSTGSTTSATCSNRWRKLRGSRRTHRSPRQHPATAWTSTDRSVTRSAPVNRFPTATEPAGTSSPSSSKNTTPARCTGTSGSNTKACWSPGRCRKGLPPTRSTTTWRSRPRITPSNTEASRARSRRANTVPVRSRSGTQGPTSLRSGKRAVRSSPFSTEPPMADSEECDDLHCSTPASTGPTRNPKRTG